MNYDYFINISIWSPQVKIPEYALAHTSERASVHEVKN